MKCFISSCFRFDPKPEMPSSFDEKEFFTSVVIVGDKKESKKDKDDNDNAKGKGKKADESVIITKNIKGKTLDENLCMWAY